MVMRTLRITLLLIIPVLLLAACAPGAVGSSASTAFKISDPSIRVGASAPFFVQADWSFANFDIRDGDLSSSLWVPTGVNSEGAVITTSFSLTKLALPDGWGVELVQVKANRRSVAGRRTFDKGSTEQTVTALFRVTPKPSAVAGPYSLGGELDYRRGQAQPFRIAFTLMR